jgi:anti-sigma factor RsiW
MTDLTHADFEAQLSAYIDGELAAPETLAMERHARDCGECARAYERQLALRAAIREQVPTFRASDRFRAQLRHALRAEVGRSAARRPAWRWLAAAAVGAGVLVGAWRLGDARARSAALTSEIVASHIRSLIGTHLTDVASTDQHTVKPWFNGRLDFSPPVYDFAGRGFPLIGGRLDYVGTGPVAALVYGRRQHVINLFLWPAERGGTGGPHTLSRQGYHMLHWTTNYAYWVVSDLGTAELEEFARLVREADATAAR